MGKPQVRLVGGGWCVGVDARELGAGVAAQSKGKGKEKDKVEGEGEDEQRTNRVNGVETDAGKARWARCGCWPNAVVRPVICRDTRRRKKKGEGGTGGHENGNGKPKSKGKDTATAARRHREGCGEPTSATEDIDEPPPSSTDESDSHSHLHTDTDSDSGVGAATDTDTDADSDTDDTTLSFALFALRDLRADEEIVLGWEWDDGHAVHMLPALMESPGMFGCVSILFPFGQSNLMAHLPSSSPRPGFDRAAHLHHLRAQFISILHALSSTFTTCACGSSARDCAVKVMERVVDGRWPWPGARTGRSHSRGRRSRSCNGTSNGTRDNVAYASGSGSCGESALSSGSEVDPDGTESEREGIGMCMQGGRTPRPNSNSKSKPRAHSNSILKNGETHSHLHAHATNGEGEGASRRPRPIDLGPLVGVQRGFRTREREPMSGGWCGVELVPSSLAWPDGVDVDIDIDVEGDTPVDVGGGGKSSVKGRSKERKRRRAEKGKARATNLDGEWRNCCSQSISPTMHAEVDVDDSPNVGSEHILPPRMRKLWPRPHHPEPQPASDNATEGTVPATIVCDGNGMNGQETEFDTETEGEDTADGEDLLMHSCSFLDRADTRQMPPPPMPASLDPTTVSSLVHAYIRRSASPLAPAVPGAKSKDLDGSGNTKRTHSPRVPPRWGPPWGVSPPPLSTPSTTPTAISTSTPATATTGGINSPQPILASHFPSSYTPIHSTMSPSVPFSKLSLLSPDMQSGYTATGNNSSADSPHVQLQRSCARDPPQLDVKRASNAEPYRVRFVSPEVLGGAPALTTQDGTADANGVYTESANVNGVGLDISHQGENEAMDVDIYVDVVGEGMPAAPYSPDQRQLDVSPEDNCATDSTIVDIESPPSPSPQPVHDEFGELGATETTTQSSHTESELDPPQSACIPSPPPVPKVKMSLKDFALRRKKQREEELAAKSVGSPGLASVALPSSPIGDDKALDVDMKDGTNGVEDDVPVDCDGIADASGPVQLSSEGPEVPAEDGIRPPTPPHVAEAFQVTHTQTKGSPDVAETLVAKLEAMDEVLFNETIADERTLDVVSFAPEPPPPPLSKAMTEINHVDGSPSLTSMSTSSSSDSRSTSVSAAPHPRTHQIPNFVTPRRPAHEDGEIFNSSPPKAYVPQSHTPPTQPRSFQATRPASPGFSPGPSTAPSASRRPQPQPPPPAPPPPPPSRSASGPTPVSNGLSRPLPSGPRALRGTMSQPSYTTYPPPPARPYSGSQYVPRGPSADRDRTDWDRDRSWSGSARSRGRAGSNGWRR